MRLKAALLLLMAVALKLALPKAAVAQGGASPGQDQYQDSSDAAADVADIPSEVANNVTDGAGPVSEALSEQSIPAAAAKELKALPETGGVSPAALCSGVLLVMIVPLVYLIGRP